MKEIRINSGDVCYAIVNERGENVGEIRFNPNDLDIYRRAEEVEQWFTEQQEGGNHGNSYEDYVTFCDAIREKFNYMLNRQVDKEIFRVCSPLTMTENGSMFFIEALKAIIQIVKEEQQERYALLEKSVDEAVAEITNE